MKGLRRVIVSDALIAQVLTKGYRMDKPQVVVEGIPRGANLVGIERPALEFGVPQVGATAFVFEHESFDVTPDGDVPTLAVHVVDVVH